MSSRKLPPFAIALLGLALVLTACTDDPTTEPSPTASAETSTSLTPSPSPTPTPSPPPSASPTPSPTPTPSPIASSTPSPASTAVPDDLSTITDDGEVTIAEAQAVIDIQNQIYNDALLDYLHTRPETGRVGTDFPQAVVSIMTDQLATDEIDLWELAFENQPEKINTEDPKPVSEDVRRVMGFSDGCVSLRLERATGGLSVDGTPPSIWVMRLVDSRVGSASNESGWYRDAMKLEEFQEEGEVTCPA